MILSVFLLNIFLIQSQASVRQKSHYEIHAQQNFNQPRFYPIEQKLSPNLYQPVADWVGKLILPNEKSYSSSPQSDWVYFEVQHTPPEAQKLLGKVVRLEWKNEKQVLSYVEAVTQDVSFTSETKQSEKKGIVHPSRLNGRQKVGPLQSLAGSRPNDSVIVTLKNTTSVIKRGSNYILQIDNEPLLATGRFYGLVEILKKQRGVRSEFFQVRHYNSTSRKFDGIEETIRIPQQVADERNFLPSTSRQIENSPAGKSGWYIYGAEDKNDVFVVQALAPRALFQLQSNQTISGLKAGINYIQVQNWRETEKSKGTINRVTVEAVKPIEPVATQPAAQSNWSEGDKAIVIHLFGGIGGKKGEHLAVSSTVTGHFSFGMAQVIRERLTNELRFDIEYQQVYAQNPDAIISGRHTWADYMGNLQWGWLATRPVSDVLVKFDAVTEDYNFDGVKLSPLGEFQQQLQVMTARYRVGDGTGNATVTTATSCVQDSSQALYTAIVAIRQKVSSTPEIIKWLETHPNDPQTLRFQKLVSLGSALEKQLMPLGIVRKDWKSNASALAGTGVGDNSTGSELLQNRSVLAGLTTWRTIMPRQVHDELATIFLKNGAKLWFLRTNQVGGWQADILPLAPTVLLGQIMIPFTDIPPVPIILNRLLTSLAIPESKDWLIAIAGLLIYGAITIPLGLFSKFLTFKPKLYSLSPIHLILLILRCLITPAITEELVFRVLVLPLPIEVLNWGWWVFRAGLMLLLFVIYHPLNAKTFYKEGFPTFFNPVFLISTWLLGLTCTIVYALTSSFWMIVFVHWVVVVLWLVLFGGLVRLSKHEHKISKEVSPSPQ